MAIVAEGTRKKLSSLNPPQGNVIAGHNAAAEITYGMPCRITAAGVVPSVGAEDVDGFALGETGIGEPISLLKGGERLRYGSGLAVGTNLYLDPATPGRLNTTQGAGDNATRVARVIEPHVIAVYERHLTPGV